MKFRHQWGRSPGGPLGLHLLPLQCAYFRRQGSGQFRCCSAWAPLGLPGTVLPPSSKAEHRQSLAHHDHTPGLLCTWKGSYRDPTWRLHQERPLGFSYSLEPPVPGPSPAGIRLPPVPQDASFPLPATALVLVPLIKLKLINLISYSPMSLNSSLHTHISVYGAGHHQVILSLPVCTVRNNVVVGN